MKLAPAQLAKHLQGPLAPVYAVSGDDPLLCQEACDAIRAACRAREFSERQVFHVDAGFDWNLLREAGASLSLFAERRLLELRMPAGKPSEPGVAALLDYLARPPEDTVLLLSLPRLDGKTQKARWAKALIDGEACQFMQVWPVDAAQLPQWLRQRLAQAGLAATPEAIDLLVARTEGNLLAAVQEIEKLRLLVEGNQLDAATVQASVADSARFDLFGLLDAALAGEAAHALRMLEGLRGEGVEAPVVLWGWPANCACSPPWPGSRVRAYRWNAPSARPGHRSSASARRWSAAPCSACRPAAGAPCSARPSASTSRSRARPPATCGTPWPR